MARQDILAGRAFVELALKDDQFLRGLRRASGALRSFGEGVATFGGGMLKLGAAMLAPLAAAVTHFVRTGDALSDMADRTKIAATRLAELKYAAEKADVELSDVEKALWATAQAVQALRDGSQEARDHFQRLGLAAADFVGLSLDEQFALISKRLAALDDQNQRIDLAKSLFGRMGPALLVMTDQLEKLRAEARRKGLIPSETAIRQAGEIDDAFKELKKTFSAAVFELGGVFGPTVKETLALVQQLAAASRKWIEDNRAVVAGFAKLGTALLIGGAVFLAAGKGIIFISNTFKGLATLAGGLGAILSIPFLALAIGGGVVTAVARRVSLLGRGLLGLGGRAVAAVAGLSRLGVVARQVGANLGRILLGTGQIAAGLATMGVTAGASLARGIGQGLARAAQAIGPRLRGVMASAWRGAMSNLPRELGVLGGIARAAVDRMRPAWNLIGPHLRKAVLVATVLAAPVLDRLRESGRLAANAVASAWRTVGPRISAGLRGALVTLNRLRAAGVSAASAAGRAIRSGAGGVGRGLGGLASGLGGLLSLVGSGAGGMLGQMALVVPQVLMLGTALGSLLTPFGLVAAAVAGGVALWMRYSESGRETFARITAALAPFIDTFKTTFGGIKDAIAGGDLGLAAEIGMAGFKLAMLQGMQALGKLLPGVWGDTLGKLGGQLAGGDLTGAWQTAVTAMSSAWAAFSAGVVGVFATAAKALLDLWQNTTTKISNMILQSASEGGWGQWLLAGTGVDMQAEKARSAENKRRQMEMGQRGLAREQEALQAIDAGKSVIGPDGQPRTRADVEQGIKNYQTMIAQAGGPDTFLQDAQQAAADQLKGQADSVRQQIDAIQTTADAAAADARKKQQTAVGGGSSELDDAVKRQQEALQQLRDKAAAAAADRARQEADDAAGQVGDGGDVAAGRGRLFGTFSAAALLASGANPVQRATEQVRDEVRRGNKMLDGILGEVRGGGAFA